MSPIESTSPAENAALPSFPLKAALRHAAQGSRLMAEIRSRPRSDRKQVAHALVELERDGIAVGSSLLQEPWETGRDFRGFSLQSVIAAWISVTNAPPDTVCALANKFVAWAGEDLTVGTVFSAWRSYLNRHPEAVTSLLDAGGDLLQKATLLQLARIDQAGLHKRLTALLSSDVVAQQELAVDVAATAEFGPSFSRDLFDRLQVLDVSCRETLSVLRARSLVILSSRVTLSSEDVATVEAVLSSGSALIRHACLGALHLYWDELSSRMRFLVLACLPDLTAEAVGTLDAVGSLAYRMRRPFDPGQHRALVFGLAASEADLSHRELSSVGAHLLEAPGGFALRLVAEMLVSPNHATASQALSLFRSHGRTGLRRADLDFLREPADRKLLVRRLMGWAMFEHDITVSLLCAVLDRADPTEWDAIFHDIIGFWFRNFPSDLDLFRQASEQGILSAEAFKALNARAEPFISRFEDMPRVQAFAVPAAHRVVQRALSAERSRAVSKAADESSILASLFTRVTLLHGSTAAYTRHPGGDRSPVRAELPMQSIEHSLAIPRLSVMAPVYYEYCLLVYRRSQRGDP